VIDPANPKEKGEGAFYIWSAAELSRRLPAVRVDLWRQSERQCSDDPHGEFTGKNILYLREPLDDATEAELQPAKAALLAIRSKRVRPHLDDKILTAWNGLMISAFAKGAQVLDERGIWRRRNGRLSFILTRMYDAKSGVAAAPLSRWRCRPSRIPGRLRVLHWRSAGSIRSRFRPAAYRDTRWR
jgi:uncharacterized protein YyaL (SSP411 family)